MGHNLLELAKQNPEQHIVGVDPFMNGVTSVINTCVQENIKNILIFPHPAQEFLESFKKIFFEKKHHKRRLFQAIFVKKILEKIEPKGKLYFATDNQNYYEQALECLSNPTIQKIPIIIKKTDPKELILTKYFARAEKLGNKVNFLVIVKS